MSVHPTQLALRGGSPAAIRAAAHEAPAPAETRAPGPAPTPAIAMRRATDVDRRLSEPPAQPLSPRELTAAGAFLGSAGDPTLILMALAEQMQRAESASAQQDILSSGQRSERAHDARMRCLERADQAARRAGRLMHRLPPRLRRAVQAIVVAAAAAASVCSGGAAAGLAIAGAALLLSAGAITKGLVEAGIVPKDKAAFVSLGLKLAGSVLMCGAGAASGAQTAASGAQTLAHAGASTAQASRSAASVSQLARTVQSVAQVVERVSCAVSLAGSGLDAGAAVLEHRATLDTLRAAALGHRREAADEDTREALAVLERVVRAFTEARGHVLSMMEAQRDALTGTARALA